MKTMSATASWVQTEGKVGGHGQVIQIPVGGGTGPQSRSWFSGSMQPATGEGVPVWFGGTEGGVLVCASPR